MSNLPTEMMNYITSNKDSNDVLMQILTYLHNAQPNIYNRIVEDIINPPPPLPPPLEWEDVPYDWSLVKEGDRLLMWASTRLNETTLFWYIVDHRSEELLHVRGEGFQSYRNLCQGAYEKCIIMRQTLKSS